MSEIKRKRKPKEIPLFQKIEGSDNKFINYENISYRHFSNNTITFSRLNEFIPIHHIISNNISNYYRINNYWNNSGVSQIKVYDYFNKTLLHKIIKERFSYEGNLNGLLSNVKITCNNFIQDNDFKEFTWNYTSNLERFYEEFIKGGNTRLNTRGSYNIYSNYYSIYATENSNLIPILLFCTSSENYDYFKLNTLVNNVIDLKKSVLFVDRMIDSPSFRFKNIRMLYKKQIEPFLIEKGFKIYKVPNDFIVNNCMIPEVKPPINIIERKKFISEVVENFKNSVCNT